MKHNKNFKSHLFRKIGKLGLALLSLLAALSIWLLALYSLNFI